MDYFAFKLIHIVGVLFVFTSLGGLLANAWLDGGKAGRKLPGLTHGLALVVVLISGFAILGNRGYEFALWVWLKLAVWLAIGASLALIRRRPDLARALWLVLPLLGGIAAYLALYKPGV